MTYVLFNYFETPDEATLFAIASFFCSSEIEISKAGKNDPPKQFNGNADELYTLLNEGKDLTNYTFIESRNLDIQATIEFHNDSRWEHSTISMSCSTKELLEALCRKLNESIVSYLCIVGESGKGSSQDWSVIYKSEDCPESILRLVENA